MNRTRIRVAVARSAGQPFFIEECELDAPGSGEELVRLHACGICHTGIAAWQQRMPVPIELPKVLGHEGAGVVEAVGLGVRA